MHYAQRIPNQDVWSIMYDGRTIVDVLLLHPERSYKNIIERIRIEGGIIDDEHIIHRGTASVALSYYRQ